MTIGTAIRDSFSLARRIIETDDESCRAALLDAIPAEDGTARAVIAHLLEEAERLIGADPRRMERVCTDALALAARAGDDYGWAMARFKQGESCTLQDRNAEGRAYLDEAAAAFTRLGLPVEAARTRIPWVWATANLGGDADALRAARAARRVFAAHGATLRLATLDLHVGLIHLARARFVAALRHFSRTLALYQTLGEPARAARAQYNRGLALVRLGRYPEAIAAVEAAAALYQATGQPRGFALARRTLGEIHLSLGRYAAALRAFDEARPRFEALQLHAGLVWLARDTADCYLRLNRPDDAILALAGVDEHLRHEDRASDIFAIATRRAAAYLLSGRHDAALDAIAEAQRRSPTGDRHDRALLAAQRAAALLHEGAPQEAEQAAREAAALARASGIRRLLIDARLLTAAAALALDRVPEAEHIARQACHAAGRQDAAPLLSRAWDLLGRTAEAAGRPDLALRRYRASVRQLEREQQGVIFEFRDSFAQGRGGAYERLAALELARGRPRRALITAERAKSRALIDALSGALELRPRGSGPARRLMRELAAAREAYAAAFVHRDQRRDRADQTAPDLTALEARVGALVRGLQLAGASDAAELYQVPATGLPKPRTGETLIEFFVSGDDALRFTFDRRGVRGVRLAGAMPELERGLRLLRLNLDSMEGARPAARGRLAAQARALLGRIYERLLGDLRLPPRRDHLVIVPHGLLHYLPFHALYDGTRYLVERYVVTYAPSAALYEVCRERARDRSRRRALVLAHSRGGELPHVLAEGKGVSAALHAPLHAEAAATRVLIERAGRRAGLIHIAAHGEFRADAPLFSHIALDDGPLTTADVFNLDLCAALVVLSACETGRSMVGGGDELVGLVRAFLYAGTAGLLVSQWRVEDRSTAALMDRFYRAYTRPDRPLGAAAALRAAQMALIAPAHPEEAGFEHPFFWAPFQVIGSG